jgi:O-antigen/teichoic acid export membrane protein|tara:strand:+ start:2166 stop:3296 length:1131 start_codon:yes stop_codon:yes gene_type:complete
MELKKIKEIVILGGGDIVGSLLSAIFWFYLASQIEPEHYGEIHWFLGIAGIFSSVALFGSMNTLTVYRAKNIQIQSTLYFISLIASIILSLIVIIFFPSFFTFDVGLILIAYVINTLAIGDILGRKQYSIHSKYILTQKGLTLGLGLLFFHLFGYEGVLFALAISYIFFLKRIFSVFREMKINFKLLKEKIRFISNNYLVFLMTGALGGGQVNTIIVAPLLGFTMLGNYSLALQAINIMMIFSAISYKYLLPQDATKMSNNFFKIAVILLSIIIAMVGVFVGPYLIENYFVQYIDAKLAIQIMSLSIIPGTISLFQQSKFLGNEQSGPVMIASSVSLVTLVVSMIILGLNFGIIGLSFSLIIGNLSKVIAFFFLKK